MVRVHITVFICWMLLSVNDFCRAQHPSRHNSNARLLARMAEEVGDFNACSSNRFVNLPSMENLRVQQTEKEDNLVWTGTWKFFTLEIKIIL